MRLSEWLAAASQSSGGGEAFARRAAAKALQELFPDEDPMVFGTIDYGQVETDPFVVTLLAPFTVGLATSTLRHKPRDHRAQPHVAVHVRPWLGVAATMRLTMDGDPEQAPLPLAAQVAEIDLAATRATERAELLAFYEAAAALAK